MPVVFASVINVVECVDDKTRRTNEFYTFIERNGAGDEIRTHDFNLGKVALYP